jgi:NADH-quinone oxidoreductase subunit N
MKRHDTRSTEAGLKYLLLGALASALLLYGMVFLYAATGSTLLPEISRSLGGSGALGAVAAILVIAGFGFKIAAVPFHMWAPDVYQGAPTPTTAFLSVASKSAGFVILLRILMQGLFPVVSVWEPIMAGLAIVTMTVGNIAAMRQTDIKRLMGYSSIAQAGYALMVFATPGTETASALIFFLLAYTVTNLGAFAAIIAVGGATGSDEIADYRGLAQRNGSLALLTLLCFLSLVGMPPMAGFVSKFYLFYAVFNNGGDTLVIIAVLNSAIAAYYYIKVVRAMYFGAPAASTPIDVPRSLRAPLWIATAATIVIGIAAMPVIAVTAFAGQRLFP